MKLNMKHLLLVFVMQALCVAGFAQTTAGSNSAADSKTLARQQKQNEKKAAKLKKEEEKRKKREAKEDKIDTRKSETYVTPVYMFFFSVQFGDSVVYVTSLQEVQDVQLTRKYDYLYFRGGYGEQFALFLAKSYGASNQTTSVFFDKDRKKILKRFNKVMKKYESDKGLMLRMITDEQFRFRAEPVS